MEYNTTNENMKESKKPYVVAIMLALLLVVTITATSYAYFTATVTGTGNNTVVTTTSLEIEFTDGPAVSLQNALPGSYIEKTFKVENKGNGDTTYDVYMSDLINDFEDKTDLVYTLTSNDGGYNEPSQTQIPSEASKIVNSQLIRSGEEHNYTLRIAFKETNDNQDDNKGKQFSTIIRVNEVKDAGGYKVISGNLETVGSVVKIANEEFYVIGQEDETHVKLLSKWNLKVGSYGLSNNETGEETDVGQYSSSDAGYGLQSSEVISNEVDTGYYWRGYVPFSSTDYWKNNSNYSETMYRNGMYNKYVYDSNASIKQYVDNYVNYLSEQGANVTGRLIKIEELYELGCVYDLGSTKCDSESGESAPAWVYQTDYWTGSTSQENDGNYGVDTYSFVSSDYDAQVDSAGVRPVIILDVGNYDLKSITSCPGCVFTYATIDNYLIPNYNVRFEEPTVLISSQYKEDYRDVVRETEKNYFLGLRLNASGTIDKGYICGIEEGTPFCIESYAGEPEDLEASELQYIINKNEEIMHSVYQDSNCSADSEGYRCTGNSVNAFAPRSGRYTKIYTTDGDCMTDDYSFYCNS